VSYWIAHHSKNALQSVKNRWFGHEPRGSMKCCRAERLRTWT